MLTAETSVCVIVVKWTTKTNHVPTCTRLLLVHVQCRYERPRPNVQTSSTDSTDSGFRALRASLFPQQNIFDSIVANHENPNSPPLVRFWTLAA